MCDYFSVVFIYFFQEPSIFQLDEVHANLPVNLSSCLALNLAYQELISEEIQNLVQLLRENEERREIQLIEIDNDETQCHSVLTKKNNFSVFTMPYFKDANTLVRNIVGYIIVKLFYLCTNS